MAHLFLDGAPVDRAILGTNDGLNYGRFDAPGLEVRRYELLASAEEVIAAFSSAFTVLVEEMRVDDLRDDEPSALMRMGYPTLREAFRWPRELCEVIDIFLDVEILSFFAPFTAESQLVINSTDEVRIDDLGLHIVGRCFRRRQV